MKRTDNKNLKKLARIGHPNQKMPPSLQLRCLVAVVVVAALSGCSHRASAQPIADVVLPEIVVQAQSPETTFRNDRGQTTGTAATSGNQTTYRDDRGRTTGTATIDSSGTTTFRDDRGRTIGTATTPRQW
jgi:hypothetical protein